VVGSVWLDAARGRDWEEDVAIGEDVAASGVSRVEGASGETRGVVAADMPVAENADWQAWIAVNSAGG